MDLRSKSNRRLTCIRSGFWHLLWVCVCGLAVRVISALTRDNCPWHCGWEDQRPLVVVLETVRLRHTVIYIEVRRQGNLLSRGGLFRSRSTEPLFTVTWWRGAPLQVGAWFGACIWEGSEAWDVIFPVRTDVGWGGGMRTGWEGLLEHLRTKWSVTGFPLVSSGTRSGADVRGARSARLALTVQLKALWAHTAGRMVGEGYVGILGIRSDRLTVGAVSAVSVLGFWQSQIIGAVPLRAAGFGHVPQDCTFSTVPSAVWQLLLLTLPALWAAALPVRTQGFSARTGCVLRLSPENNKEIIWI